MKRTSRSARQQKHYARFVFRTCAFLLIVVGCVFYTQLFKGRDGESALVDSAGLRGSHDPSYSPRFLRQLTSNSTNNTTGSGNSSTPTGACASSEESSTYPKPVIDPRVAGQQCVFLFPLGPSLRKLHSSLPSFNLHSLFSPLCYAAKVRPG